MKQILKNKINICRNCIQNQLKLANKIIYNYNYNAGSEHLVHQIFQYLELIICNVEMIFING